MKVFPISCGLGYGFLIEVDQGLFLIDCGSPGHHQKVLSKMVSIGRKDLKLILITHAHYDHYGNAHILRGLTGACIAIHHQDAQIMASGGSPLGTSHNHGFLFKPLQYLLKRINPLPPTKPDILLRDGDSFEKFGLNAFLLHTPGHTPGHSCIILEDGTAFAGDLLGRVPRVKPQNLLATNWQQIPASLQKFKSSPIEQFYTGHSIVPVPGDVLGKI